MAKICSFNQFLLRRAAAADLKAAGVLKDMAGRAGQWCETIESACANAEEMLTAAIGRSSEAVAGSQQERQRTLSVLESGDLDRMIAERDRLALKLSLRGKNKG